MARKKKKPDFDEYYSDLFASRWPSLRSALAESSSHTELTEGLIHPYYLDRASLFPVEALMVEQAHTILDLCAAPGGKALAIAGRMNHDALLTVNDRSSRRRARLHHVLDEHLATDVRSRITVTGHDASRWGLYEQEAYDRVLADVPCSSERHLVQNPVHLGRWTPARTRHLAVQAYAILAAAFAALKPGGFLVYSTCALSPAENDGVVAKLLKRQPTAEVPAPQEPAADAPGEQTTQGRIILPDTCGGLGPIYYALIKKSS